MVAQRVVAAARREPAQVLGDANTPIKQLVDLANADPRRGEHHATHLARLSLDAIALAVVPNKATLPTRSPRKYRGPHSPQRQFEHRGTAIDVTERVHPAVRRVLAMRPGLSASTSPASTCGSRHSRPLEEQGGVIVEVNAAPGLRMHLEPSVGISRPVGEAIVDMLFPKTKMAAFPSLP